MGNEPHLVVVDADREIGVVLARFACIHRYRIETTADGREKVAALGAGRST